MQKMSFGPESEIAALRGGLFLVFLIYPLLFLQVGFLDAILDPFLNAVNFFLTVAVFSALLASLTLNYAFGYVAFLAVMVSDFAFGAPLVIFTSHLAIALSFGEGTSSLGMYQSVARQIRQGTSENASLNLRGCLHRFRRMLILVSASLFALSGGYALLPEIIPTPTGLSALALYAMIGLIAIALTVLYLGSRD